MESKVKYGQEIGVNLIKIAKKLLDNQDLCKLLVNTDLDPLNPNTHPNNIDGISLLHKNIRVVPLVTAEDQTTESKIVLLFDEGEVNRSNSDNENLSLLINIYCPFKEWSITGDTLRPFAIMSEIRKIFDLDDEGRRALGVESLPLDLNEATIAFKKDKLMQEAMGDHTVKKLIEAKTIEWNEYHKFVTNWEIKRYINKY